MQLFRGGELRASKIKTVLFLYAVCLLAATKTLEKGNFLFILKSKTYKVRKIQDLHLDINILSQLGKRHYKSPLKSST